MKNISIFFFIILLLACSKNESISPKVESIEEVVQCRLLSIDNDVSSPYEGFSLEYDINGNLESVTYMARYDGEYNYEYQLFYVENKLSSIEEKIYTSNPLHQAEYESHNIQYEGDNVSKISSFSKTSNGLDAIWEQRFVYTNDKITSMTAWSNLSETGEVVDFELEKVVDYTVTYNEENVSMYSMLQDGHQEMSTYQYDTMSNPFKGNLFWFIWTEDLATFISDNNVVSEVYEDIDEEYPSYSRNYEYSFSYDYNSYGFPIEVVTSRLNIDRNELDEWVVFLNYECNP